MVDEEMPDYEEEEQPQEISPDNLQSFSGYQRNVYVPYGEAERQEPVFSHLPTDIQSKKGMHEEYPLVRKVDDEGHNGGFQDWEAQEKHVSAHGKCGGIS